MKKIAYLLTTVFAVCALASCGDDKGYSVNPEINGGSGDEKTAILEALNKKPLVTNKNGDTIKPLSTLPDLSKMDRLIEDDGDYVKLTTQQLVKVNDAKYTVKIEWNVDQSQEYFASLQQSDEDAYHKILELKYKGYGVADGQINWEIKSMTCGEAAVAKPSELKYGAVVVNQIYYHVDTTIADFNKVNGPKTVTDGDKTYNYPSTFDIVDYDVHPGEKYSPYFKVDEHNVGKEKDYYYVNVPGKVIYTAPDGNWALISDGNNILELYAGSALDLKTTTYPNLEVNKNVIVSGNASVYQGNIQVGFITKISKLEDASKIDTTDPTFETLSADVIDSWKDATLGIDKQSIAGLSNSLRKVSGTVVADSIRDKNNNKVTNISSLENNRFTFDLQVDADTKITVAYDYHTDRDKSQGLFNKLKEALGTKTPLTIEGTMRYSNGRGDERPFFFEKNDASKPAPCWNIVPFKENHVNF